jgi:hypothetical protein
MRVLAALVLLAACHDEPTCPSTLGLYCDRPQEGLTCGYTEESGAKASCRCAGGLWECNDCPGGAAPVGTCAAGDGCAAWGFENACACTCDANGQWSCSVDDPDPNFHCSP